MVRVSQLNNREKQKEIARVPFQNQCSAVRVVRENLVGSPGLRKRWQRSDLDQQ